MEGEAWYSAGRLAEVHGASTQWEHSRRGAEVRDDVPKGRHRTTTILLHRTSYKVAAAVVKTCPRLVYSKVSTDTPHTHTHTHSSHSSLPSHCHPPPPFFHSRTAAACSLGWWMPASASPPLRKLLCRASPYASGPTSTMYISSHPHTHILHTSLPVLLPAVCAWPAPTGPSERRLYQTKNQAALLHVLPVLCTGTI